MQPYFPQTLDTADVVPSVFWLIAEHGYNNCDPENFESKDDFDEAVANCLDETLSTLLIAQPRDADGAEWIGQFYDLLTDRGLRDWPEDEE